MIQWPAFNFDLNLNKTVWNEIKNWIQNSYGEKFNYDQFRGVVNAAPGNFLKNLVDYMQVRCETVIRTNGMHTEFFLLL